MALPWPAGTNGSNPADPADVWGPDEYDAPAPHRPDASTVTFYGDNPGGNSFDRTSFLQNMGTKTTDDNGNQAKPLGKLVEKGFGAL